MAMHSEDRSLKKPILKRNPCTLYVLLLELTWIAVVVRRLPG